MCTVGAGLRIKIADFGLTRAVHNKDYYKVGGAVVLPVRWMAPESLLYGLFHLASDIWYSLVLILIKFTPNSLNTMMKKFIQHFKALLDNTAGLMEFSCGR